MTNWLEAIENPEAVTSLFDRAPSLESVEITTLDLDRDGPTLTLSVLLRDYPVRPPTRWQRSGFNTAAIRLQMLGVENVMLEGWSTENRATITVERDLGGLLIVQAKGATFQLRCSCGWLRVDGVSAYHRADELS
jgi:hypothetical protein